MNKLTTAQQEVVDKLGDGWTLRGTRGIFGRNSYWLSSPVKFPGQKVNANTAHALIERGLITAIRNDLKGAEYKLRTPKP